MTKAIGAHNEELITNYANGKTPGLGTDIQSDISYALIKLKIVLRELYELQTKRDTDPEWEASELDIITDSTLEYVVHLIGEAQSALLENFDN